MKFIGKFKDLKSIGFTFHKLYARDYKVYEKNKVWVWVKGRTVEVQDLYSKSKYVIKMVLDGKWPLYKEDKTFKNMIFFKKNDPMPCMMDKETGEIEERNKFFEKRNIHGLDRISYDYDKYRELLINKETYNTILELREMIEL